LDKEQRVYLYAFLSTVFSEHLSIEQIENLKMSKELLEMISPNAASWFYKNSSQELEEALNRDFTSMFLIHSLPIESAILDSKAEVLVGLQNPVMQFYFSCGYELNLNDSKLNAPDHISLECGFMQNLIQREEKELQISFLQNHLLKWVPVYFLGMKTMAKTPFYKELCDFCADFILADYDALVG
jgi:putative dimethyl sulfoxide reductase chaperone